MAAKVSQQFFQRLSESFDEQPMDLYVYSNNFLVNAWNCMKFCMNIAEILVYCIKYKFFIILCVYLGTGHFLLGAQWCVGLYCVAAL